MPVPIATLAFDFSSGFDFSNEFGFVVRLAALLSALAIVGFGLSHLRGIARGEPTAPIERPCDQPETDRSETNSDLGQAA